MGRRANGFGTLVSKGPGRPWLARWSYRGKIYTRSTGQRDRAKAAKELERLTRPFREGAEAEVIRSLEARVAACEDRAAESADVRLEDMADAWAGCLEAKGVAESTAAMYEGYARQLAEWLLANTSAKTMKQVTREDAERRLSALADSSCEGTYNVKLVFYKRLWTALAAKAGLRSSPWAGFRKMKAPKASRRRPLEKEEVAKVLDRVRTSDRWLVLFATGIYTGLRLGDCACLRWEDVDLGRRVVRVMPMKTKRHMSSPVEIPVHPSLAAVLERWRPRASENEGYVCLENALAYRRRTMSRQVREILRSCGVATSERDADGRTRYVAGFHSLRHLFVSMAINTGMNPMLVRQVVGHSSVDMTAAYYHSNGDVVREGVERLPDFIGGGRPLETAPAPLGEEGLSLLRAAWVPEDGSLDGTVRRLLRPALGESA